MASADGYSVATANREEAARAKEIALQKLQAKDWDGAKRLLLKAQRLCPDLDGVAACIIVAEVHIIAESTTHTAPYLGISRDYYAILDVRPDVTKQALSQQYKKRAFQLHPDKNQTPGAEAAFKLLGEAFETLKDDEKRRKYDNVRSRTPYQNAQTAPTPSSAHQTPQGAETPTPNPLGGARGCRITLRGVAAATNKPPRRGPYPETAPGMRLQDTV